MISWRDTRVSADGTHHTLAGRAIYAERFHAVLKYHAPGLAPVRKHDEAWHIDIHGRPAYATRFRQTFGFYEGRAAVEADDGWHHIHVEGTAAYPERYTWCGNFQGGRCPVRLEDGRYRHIHADGRPVYSATWRYAGDYRDSIAVVQRDDGRSTHVDAHGRLLHGQWFSDLDVFHKGFARARDARGWMHINEEGRPAYTRRFANVEPFYNGQARVERFHGGLEIINETGVTLCVLRHDAPGAIYEHDRLGGWMVGEEVHRSGNGAIYDAPPDALIKSTSNLSAWAREVEILQFLAGEGAPRLMDAFTRATTGYLVMERITGAPLGMRNTTERRSLPEALRLVRSLLRTLNRLHVAGWAHTDLHPDNILDRDGLAVLLDPASAVHLDGGGRWSGEIHWGRWEFIPPEQFEGFTTLDRSVDTYAVCGLLSYLATGQGPFPMDVAALRHRGWGTVREAFIRARSNPAIAALPPMLKPIVGQGLSARPEDRFPTAEALLAALEVIHA